MKKMVVILILVAACLAAAGAAFALEMSGTVTAVDTAKNTLTLKGEKVEAGFDCETGTLLTGIKVGDQVTVQYDEVGQKKRATKITPMKQTKKAPVGC
jgi:Cu/Ag efflux protein CusF